MRFLIFLLPFIMSISTQSNAQELEDYKWKNRIILLMNSEDSSFKNQLKLLKGHKKELAERDIIIFQYSKNQLLDIDGNTSNINSKTIPYKNHKGVLLIGKDGGVKLKKDFITQPNEIFELIDSMPMRRAEMKNDR